MENQFSIHPDTRIAHVELQVKDLPDMLAFYGGLLGFQVVDNTAGRATLSPTGQPPALLTLTESKEAPLAPSTAPVAGLYHTAFRFPGRRSLATVLLRIIASEWPLQGASDHRVSEAIYLADPEGNGIEIYRDRPREDWPRLQDSIQMGNLPLDLRKLLEEADQTAAQHGVIDPGTDIGHIHLQVSNLATADAFYHHLLGLDVMMSMPTALFMAAGGYHHHIGANTWHSLNAPKRDPQATGLNSYALLIPDEGGWLTLFDRLKARSYQLVERDGRAGIRVEDQDGLQIEVLTADSSAVRQALAAPVDAKV